MFENNEFGYAEIMKEIGKQKEKAYKILELIADAIHAESGIFWIYMKNTDEKIHPIASFGNINTNNCALRLNEGILGKTILKKDGEIIADCKNDPRWVNNKIKYIDYDFKTVVFVPMQYDNYSLCIEMNNKTNNDVYNEDDYEIIKNITDKIIKLLNN